MARFNSPLMLLRSAIQSVRRHPQILYPIVLIAFLNLLLLELLYFAPRYPLSTLCAPFIRRIWGEKYLHYPMDLVLLPKTFYYAQLMAGLLIGNFLSAVMVHMVAAFNNEERVNFRNSVRKCLPFYIHIVTASFLALALFITANWLYGFLVDWVARLHTDQGGLTVLKRMVLGGTPYAQLLLDILVSIALVYVLPIIVIDGKKVLQAVGTNLRVLAKSFWLSTAIVFVPTLFYFPVLIARNNITALIDMTAPGVQVVVIAIGVLASIAINAIITVSAATYYLYRKESA